MEISPLYSWICFMFCLGLTAGGVLVGFRRREYRQHASFRYLQFYLILMYTFGFYALWSQWLFRTLFSGMFNPEKLVLLSRFLLLISVPFLVVGKTMLVFWAGSLLASPPRPRVYLILMAEVLLLAVLFGQIALPWTSYRFYAAFVLALTTVLGSLLLLSEVKYLNRMAAKCLAGLLMLSGSVHLPFLLGESQEAVWALLFILLYFLTHSLFVTYFIYQAVLPASQPQQTETRQDRQFHFEAFKEQYGITPREEEIIREIYRGKTNQEIADQLFVTVQTIKDHTHRIYQKVDVKSRAQLTIRIRSFQEKDQREQS